MAKQTGIHLLLIDAQVDFMDLPGSALPVAGAVDDMKRVAALINNQGGNIDAIHATLDSHHTNDIAHPGYWVNAQNEHPEPGTQISAQDVKDGVWVPRNGSTADKVLGGKTRLEHAQFYTAQLEADGKYTHTIWPEHCIIGSPGHALFGEISEAIVGWERSRVRNANKIVKGVCPFTEHFGGMAAEVPLDADPTTQLNTRFVRVLQQARILLIAGEALSHCERATVDQIIESFGPDEISKLHILTDCSSPVIIPDVIDFTDAANDWLVEVEKKGVKLVTSTDLDLAAL